MALLRAYLIGSNDAILKEAGQTTVVSLVQWHI
jgi:hypothetical protein